MKNLPVVVSGALANKPFNGGNAWSRLSWVLGFQRLGFDVWFVEQIRGAECVDAQGNPVAFAASVNAGYFRAVMEDFGLTHRSLLVCDDGDEVVGVPLEEARSRLGGGCLLFNISGHLVHPELRAAATLRIYYDDDPGHTQMWEDAGKEGARLGNHDHYLTLGCNVGAADCLIPTGGRTWHPTRPPVGLEQWPVVAPGDFQGFTTVASWRGAYGVMRHGGRTFGQKAHEFRKVLELPRRCRHRFELALQIHPADQPDIDRLQAHGWDLSDPRAASGTPAEFRHYIQGSGAEFSVAQGIYVDTHSGWFSDRTVRYLASGRPALVQDTGLGRHYPVGKGLLTFRTLDEAVEGAARIAADYPRQCGFARELAREFFDSDRVLGGILSAL